LANHIGTFESWICAACGYTEFYAKDLHDLERFAAEQPNDIRIVDAASPARGPFR
jgi:predicted nucleic-acid-binding Zn-ribbon protein